MRGNAAALIESFLDMMSAERGASANTIAAYRRDLMDFGAAVDAKRAARNDVKKYLAALTKAGSGFSRVERNNPPASNGRLISTATPRSFAAGSNRFAAAGSAME